MATVREIEARLASQVEDKILERLGYRETAVYLPSLGGLGQIVTPRPSVVEMDYQSASRAVGSQLLTDLSGPDRPVTLFKVEIPRTYSADLVAAEGVWHVQTDGRERIGCYALSILQKDARWVIFLVPNRNNPYN